MILGSEPGSTAEVLRRARRQAGLHRERRRPARRPWLRLRAVHERVHREARADRSADAVRAAGERPTSATRAQPSPTIGARWASCSPRSPKSLRRTRSRPRRSNASVEEIDRHRENRMICDPYPRLLVARDTVNQGAAALLMSVAAARRLGVPEDNWVYLRGHADQTSRTCWTASTSASAPPPNRRWRGASGRRHRHRRRRHLRPVQLLPVPGVRGVRRAWAHRRRPARSDADRRPAVFRRRRQQLFDARHRRDGGRHARQARLVRAGRRQRRCDEQVFGRRLLHRPRRVGARPQQGAAAGHRRAAEGAGHAKRRTARRTIETYSVRYDWPTTTGIIIGRLDADGSRFMALTEDDDLVALMTDGDPLGATDHREVDRRGHQPGCSASEV